MAVDFQSKFVRGAVDFPFTGAYSLEAWDEDEFRVTVPSAVAPGTDGEYQEDGFAEARIVTIPGILIGDNADDLRTKWEALTQALLGGRGEGKLYRSSDRYLNGRVTFLRRDKDEGFDQIAWTMGLRCADPFYYSETADTLALSSGSNAITAGGGYPATPVFTFVVTVAGTITITHAGTGQSFSLTVGTGTYIVDCGAGTVLLSPSTDAIGSFSGSFLDEGLVTSASTITLTLAGGATVTTGTQVAWRKRWTGGR